LSLRGLASAKAASIELHGYQWLSVASPALVNKTASNKLKGPYLACFSASFVSVGNKLL